jgi:hypothetical protein
MTRKPAARATCRPPALKRTVETAFGLPVPELIPASHRL